MPAHGSVPFDRAVDFYDRTRALPAHIAAAQTELLIGQLAPLGGPVLEIGVGTGRVGLPLVRAGCQLVGVDLSGPMLHRLRANDPRGSLPVMRADAAELGLRTGVFAAAVACHVLHLVGDWTAVVTELRRVVRPGGLLLATRGAARDGLAAELPRRIRAEAGAGGSTGASPGGLDDLDDLDDYLRARGASVDHLPPITLPVGALRSVEEYLQSAAARVTSWTWSLDPARLRVAVDATRDWVRATYGDPASLAMPAPPIRWRRYQFPPAPQVGVGAVAGSAGGN